jgi:hypothetical protein
VITERELDAQLAGAAGITDAELPPLPEDFLGYLQTNVGREQFRTTGTAGNEPASVIAARQLVSDARDARAATPPRRRRPGGRALLRTGVAVLAVAAAWTTAVLVTPSDRPSTPDPGVAAPAETTGVPSGPVEVDGMTLVAVDRVTFPFSLDPVPEGLTPSFGRAGGPTPFGDSFPVTWSARYRADDGAGFGFSTSHEDPRVEWEFEHELPQWTYANAEVTGTGKVDVDGTTADFVSGAYDRPLCRYEPSTPVQTNEPDEVCTSTFTDLFWERPDGQWMWLRGEDGYAAAQTLVDIAESIVDRPQPVDLQLGLAPAGWTLNGYDEGHIAFVNSADPGQRLAVGLLELWRGETVENAFQGMYDGDEHWVTVNDRPAKIVLVPQGDFDEWFLAAELDGGALFMVQVPESFTQEQLVEIAEQVTYTP